MLACAKRKTNRRHENRRRPAKHTPICNSLSPTPPVERESNVIGLGTAQISLQILHLRRLKNTNFSFWHERETVGGKKNCSQFQTYYVYYTGWMTVCRKNRIFQMVSFVRAPAQLEIVVQLLQNRFLLELLLITRVQHY